MPIDTQSYRSLPRQAATAEATTPTPTSPTQSPVLTPTSAVPPTQ